MAEYQGLTNSIQFIDRDGKVDVDKAFEYYCSSITAAKQNIKSILSNKNLQTENILQGESQRLADEFYTLIKGFIGNEPK